jgi:hypothetical protein
MHLVSLGLHIETQYRENNMKDREGLQDIAMDRMKLWMLYKSVACPRWSRGEKKEHQASNVLQRLYTATVKDQPAYR